MLQSRISLSRAAMLMVALAAICLSVIAYADGSDALDPLQRPAVVSKNPSTAVLIAIARAGGRLVAVGDAGTVILSDDGGARWSQAKVPVGVSLTSVHFEDARRGFAVGAFGRLLCTTDGGQHWRHCEGRLDNPDGNHLYAIRPAGGALVVVGERGSVYVSRDQGASFERVATPYEGSFFGVHGVPDGRLLVYGLRGHVFASADQGRSWTDLSPAAASSAVTGAATLDDGRVALVSQDGSVFVGGRPGEPLGRLPERGPSLSAAAASPGGALVAVGPRGIVVLPKPAAPPATSASASAS